MPLLFAFLKEKNMGHFSAKARRYSSKQTLIFEKLRNNCNLKNSPCLTRRSGTFSGNWSMAFVRLIYEHKRRTVYKQ